MKLIKINNEYKTITSNKVFADFYTLTINPTPADATVTFDTGEVVGNTCKVIEGTIVTYTVSKAGYATKTASVCMLSDNTVNVTLTQGIQLYGYKYSNSAYLFMLDGMTADDYAMYTGTNTNPVHQITEINGTIGAADSTIKEDTDNSAYTYTRTLNIGGVTLYCYQYTVPLIGIINELGVFADAEVGDKCIRGMQFQKPTSASSSQVVYSGNTYNRQSSIDFLYTGE